MHRNSLFSVIQESYTGKQTLFQIYIIQKNFTGNFMIKLYKQIFQKFSAHIITCTNLYILNMT